MWSGVDPDVELFASGRVLDDDGEWSGGQTLGEAGEDAGVPEPTVPPSLQPTCLCASIQRLRLGTRLMVYAKLDMHPIVDVTCRRRQQCWWLRRCSGCGAGGGRHAGVPQPDPGVGGGLQRRHAVHLPAHRRGLVPPQQVRSAVPLTCLARLLPDLRWTCSTAGGWNHSAIGKSDRSSALPRRSHSNYDNTLPGSNCMCPPFTCQCAGRRASTMAGSPPCSRPLASLCTF